MSSLWEKVVISPKIFNKLEKIRKSKVVPSVLLFVGPKGVGKEAVATAFTQSLNCLSEGNNIPCGVCSSCVSINELDSRYINFIYSLPPASNDDDPNEQFERFKDETISEIISETTEKKKLIRILNILFQKQAKLKLVV